jgi:hypothetical protein
VKGLSVQVRTRTKVQDYWFIGGYEDERWWEKCYGRWTDFSRPTLIVEPNRFFVAGIASRRTDSKGAGIHYAVLGKIESPEGASAATGLISWVCEQLSHSKQFPDLGKRLDQIGEETWAAAVNGEALAAEEVAGVLSSLMAERDALAEPLVHREEAWVCGPNELGFRELARTAASVISNKMGLAAYLNLASPDELTSLQSKAGPVGLVCRGGQHSPKPLAPQFGGR